MAHGAGDGSGGAGHGSGSHNSGKGHRHHRGVWHGERGLSGGGYRGIDFRGWSIPGHGFYFGSIPSYCRLVYWEGAPYYYADDVYYEWSGTAGGYQQVQPPAGLLEKMNTQASDTELFVFPDGDQTNEQLERDRGECHQWAADQAGVAPKLAAKRFDYRRADAACLEARDYSVE